MKTFCLLLLLSMAISATAQNESRNDHSEWDEFRFTDYDRDVAEGVGKVQKLMQGREAILQSYERTDQSIIATERAIGNLYRDRIATHKAELAYHEAMVNFKFPDDDFPDEFLEDRFANDDAIENEHNTLLSIEEEPPLIPPMFKIRSLSETEDGISIEIENLGDPIDALISVANSHGTIIATPYHQSLTNWDYPRWLSFQLQSHYKKIHILINAGGRSHQIPLFIRKHNPVIFAFPLEQRAKIGESVEYQIFIEGDGNDPKRYPISIEGLPQGTASQVVKVIQSPNDQLRSVSIQTLTFTPAFNQHELTLQVTLGKDIPKKLVGKPIPFTLQIGEIREQLSLTPLGIGELTVDVPAVVQIRLGETKEITVKLQNVGTETVSGIVLQSARTTYGVDFSTSPLSLAVDELREIPMKISIADDIPLGERDVHLMVSSSASSQTANLRLEIMPLALRLAILRGMVTPALVILLCGLAIFGGMKAQEIRQKRVQEKAQDYDLTPPTYESSIYEGSDD